MIMIKQFKTKFSAFLKYQSYFGIYFLIKNMINLSQYILEGIFDELSDTKLNKLAISAIKAWVKTI